MAKEPQREVFANNLSRSAVKPPPWLLGLPPHVIHSQPALEIQQYRSALKGARHTALQGGSRARLAVFTVPRDASSTRLAMGELQNRIAICSHRLLARRHHCAVETSRVHEAARNWRVSELPVRQTEYLNTNAYLSALGG